MNKKRQIAKIEATIQVAVNAYNRLNDACNKAIEAGAMDVNGPLHEAIWRGFSDLVDLVDVADSINWFIWENKQGKKGLVIRVGDKEFKIKSAKDLAKSIWEMQQRGAWTHYGKQSRITTS